MRVLSVIHYPTFGGPHNRNAAIAGPLAERGIDLTVLLPQEEGNAAPRLLAGGVDVISMPVHRVRAVRSPLAHLGYLAATPGDIRRIRSVIRALSADLVLINGAINPQAAFASRLEGVPVVWQLLDTFPPAWARAAVMQVIRRTADVVMATGRAVAEAHPGATGLGDRLVLFFPPVNVDDFAPNPAKRQRARAELGLAADDTVIGNVGNVNLMKGHHDFIRAAAALRASRPGTRFVILGATSSIHDEYAKALWREAESLGLILGEDLVVRDPGDRVSELAAAFDLYWLSSGGAEGIPTSVGEAMALGIPVVSTRVGAIDEAVADGETGLLVAPGDHAALAARTAELLDSPTRMRALGATGRDRAIALFATERCVDAHQRAFELALDPPG